MMSNREQMIRSCRAALSVLAGVDNSVMTEIAQMRMRSHNATVNDRDEIVNSLIDERTAAASDYSF